MGHIHRNDHIVSWVLVPTCPRNSRSGGCGFDPAPQGLRGQVLWGCSNGRATPVSRMNQSYHSLLQGFVGCFSMFFSLRIAAYDRFLMIVCICLYIMFEFHGIPPFLHPRKALAQMWPNCMAALRSIAWTQTSMNCRQHRYYDLHRRVPESDQQSVQSVWESQSCSFLLILLAFFLGKLGRGRTQKYGL